MGELNPGHPRQDPGQIPHSPIVDYAVVVLGVMYPNVFPRHPSTATIEDATYLLHDLSFGRQHAAMIFYDPFSPDGSTEPIQYRPSAGNGTHQQEHECINAPKDRQGNRREAIQAVVRDLARLSASIQER